MDRREVGMHSEGLSPSQNLEPAITGDASPRPTYAAAFRCIGSSCEDPCCREWSIPLDKKTYDRYQQFPPDKLGIVVSQYVSINATPGAPASLFARILPRSSGSCPFFEADRLCAIQKEYGAALLSSTCSIYPRALNVVGGSLEGSLMLSCPEAARNILLVPDATEVTGDLFSGDFRTDNVFRLPTQESSSFYKPYGHFHAIRSLLIEMVKDRSRPLWQRLVLVGSLCKSLDEVNAEDDEKVPGIVESHRQALKQDAVRTLLESIPAQPHMKLSISLRLTDARVQDKQSGTRFMDTFWTFVEGIGSGAEREGDDVQRYLEAEQRYYRPFFARRPFILENFLLNYIFQKLFPFGRENSSQSKHRRMFEEYVLLATQFAWVDTMLIGVAGHHKEAFAEEHVVQVVQSFCRAVEHNHLVLDSITELMVYLQLDNLQGMAVLLKS